MRTTDETREMREFLRHTVATLAYRSGKVLRDVPADFASLRPSASTRRPLDVLAHMGDLMQWATRMARGEDSWTPLPATDWESALERYFQGLRDLDASLAREPLERAQAERIFQGPVADALTHVGQLALMRGMCGLQVRPESYARADIRAGRVGRDQPAPRAEFDGDASPPR